MYFVCGIHGVGKTTFAQSLSEKTGVKCYTASELINNKESALWTGDKRVESINENQQKLLKSIKNISDRQFVLDGHMCLRNEEGEVQRIDINVFRQLEIDIIYLVIDKSINIYKRLKERDYIVWDLQYIEEFQLCEIEYAKELSKLLQVPLKIIYNDKEIDSVAIISDGNILLPIKPVYANRILAETKKYEYRKKICKKDIKKLYIYSTAPVKKIVGEADVIEKVVMEKEKLWNVSKEESGISLKFFNDYFAGQDFACAYHLGKIKKYDVPIELGQIGIDYTPQSYVYIGDIC